jgi:ribose 1,5-bisphosphate isomerase
MRDESGTRVAPVPVVTAFLWDGQAVLLARRSEAVSTFPGHWAGISGYLEGDDAAQWALVEIAEECGLARCDVTLRAAGEPLVAGDPPRTFLVHPFLFSICDRNFVRPDWEAERFEWVPVEAMLGQAKQPAVPRLYDAFARVWPPWPAEQAIDANCQLAKQWLRADRSMGAGTLARSAAREIAKLVRLAAEEFPHKKQHVLDAAEELRFVRPSMVPPINLLADVRDAIRAAASSDDALAAIDALVRRSEDAESAVVEAAVARIRPGERVMTISYSTTVKRVLEAASAKIGRVVVCESRPLYEGRRLAEDLHKAGLAVTLITDAQALAHMDRVDRVLLGADAVLTDGSVVNKVGSALLALAARHTGKPVTVVAESLKRVRDPADYQFTPETNAPGELWEASPTPIPPGIEVVNEYFERIPAQWIDETVSE